MNIAFIGLGNMGGPMARNLVKAGHAVTVFDLNQEAVAALVSEGARTAGTPAEAAREASFVLTMLPAAAHVEAVLTGPQGVLTGVPKNVPIVDCSTIDPATARRLAEKAAAHGNPFADGAGNGRGSQGHDGQACNQEY